MPEHRGDLWIANTVSDLIQGDVYEHLPLGAARAQVHSNYIIAQTENGMVFSPLGESFPAQMQPVNRTAFVGPEGGWSDKELDLFQQRQIPSYKLGRTILRAETMPSVALGLIQQAQGWH